MRRQLISVCTPALWSASPRCPAEAPSYVLTHVDLIGAKKDEGLAAIKQLNADSVQDAGILRYDVLQQGNRPNHLTLVEVWRGNSDLEKHEASCAHPQIP